MPLPVKALPTQTIVIEGAPVEFRALSRAEALHFTVGFTETAMPDADVEARVTAAEVWLLVTVMGVTDAEAERWREETDPSVVTDLIDGIIELSGLTPKDGKSPQSPSSAGS